MARRPKGLFANEKGHSWRASLEGGLGAADPGAPMLRVSIAARGAISPLFFAIASG
jgi:hypothetical protein